MAEFGQSLPALPQIYSNQALFQFTKMGFASHLAKMLVTVGMVPQVSLWPIDILAESEAALADSLDATSTHIFPFTFPDTESFSIANESWRPYVAIVVYLGGVASATSTGRQNDLLRLDSGIMRDGAASLADTRGRYRQFTTAHFGWGNQSDIPTTNGTGGVGDLSAGLYINKPDWKPYASSTSVTDTSLLATRNLFAYLGRAGLFVFVGTGSSRTTFGDILAAGFAFGGARLPNRGAAVDPNLARVNPVVTLPMQETNALVYDGLRLRALMQSMQHDLQSTLDWVWADVWNLENAEVPFYPSTAPQTVDSPRRLSSGTGAHIMGRIVTLPKEEFSNPTILYGPINARIASADTRPTFAQVFAAPYCRLCDLTAPLGDHEDPDTLENWRIVPYPSIGGTLGLYSENAQVSSVLDFGTRTLQGTRLYLLTSTSGSFPTSTPLQIVSTPSGAVMDIVHVNAGDSGVSTARWASNSSVDDWVCDMTPMTANVQLDLELLVTLPVSDPADTTYELQFDLRIRGGTEGVNGLRVFHHISSTPIPVTMVQGGNTFTGLIGTAGANTGNARYDFQTYTGTIVRDSSASTSKIRIYLSADRNGAPDDTLIEVRNLRINRYRYL